MTILKVTEELPSMNSLHGTMIGKDVFNKAEKTVI